MREYEQDTNDRERIEVEKSRHEYELLSSRIESEKKKIANGKGKGSKEALAALIEEQCLFQQKRPLRLLVDDTTPEKLADILDEQGGSVSLVSSEGGLFDALNGRYEKTLNIDIYLKAHDGDTIKIDRIGRQANHILHPKLAIILSVQPDVLEGVMGNNTMRDRGLCGRFAYVVPKSKMGYRNSTPPPIDNNIKEEYTSFIQKALTDDCSSDTLKLSEAADQQRITFQDKVEEQLREDGKLYSLRDWGGKLVGKAMRIAGLLHCADNNDSPSEIPIAAETVAAAIKIAECLTQHAIVAYSSGGSGTDSEAQYLLRRLTSTGKESLTKKEVFELARGKFKTAEALKRPLAELEARNYIRQEKQSSGKAGRPTENVIINPCCYN